jgi:hypothetical protein
MTTTKLLVTALGTMAFAVPALADDATTTTAPTTPTAQQQCRAERTQMGKDAFAQTYGTNKNRRNAFGKCVSKRAQATETATTEAKTNAAQSCKAEESADPAAFKTKYGTNKNGSNAYGKCVSQTARAAAAEQVKTETSADVSAAKSCKAERAADPAAFKAKYGTNKNQANAFGKCVSKTAKAQESQSDSTDGSAPAQS